MKTRFATIAAACLSILVLSPANMRAQSPDRETLIARLARDGPAKGIAGASITLVEFSDFRCGFCRRFAHETLPLIESTYIKSGKIRFVYRHFAIFGKPSIAAARAAACAGEQAKFWDYHDRLFADRAPVLTDGKLKAYAGELRLKSGSFNRCLDSGRHLERVESETAMGSYLGVNGTPAFFLDGQMIVGAQPFEVFRSLIEKQLESK